MRKFILTSTVFQACPRIHILPDLTSCMLLKAEVTSLCRFRELGDAMSGQMEEGFCMAVVAGLRLTAWKCYTLYNLHFARLPKTYGRNCLECHVVALVSVSSHTVRSMDGAIARCAEAILRPACLLVQSVSPDYEVQKCPLCHLHISFVTSNKFPVSPKLSPQGCP